MKKLWILVLCCLACVFAFLPLGFDSGYAFADQGEVMVIAQEVKFFEEANFDKPLTDEDGEIVKAGHGEKLKVLQQEIDNFIKVEYLGYQGFVYARYVTFNTLSQEVYPVFNASVEAVECEVFDLDQINVIAKLKKGQELYLYEGYNKQSTTTAVCFVGEDGRLAYGYIKTDELSPYGINAGVITGIVVAASCVTIILLLIFMKKKKTKKKSG